MTYPPRNIFFVPERLLREATVHLLGLGHVHPKGVLYRWGENTRYIEWITTRIADDLGQGFDGSPSRGLELEQGLEDQDNAFLGILGAVDEPGLPDQIGGSEDHVTVFLRVQGFTLPHCLPNSRGFLTVGAGGDGIMPGQIIKTGGENPPVDPESSLDQTQDVPRGCHQVWLVRKASPVVAIMPQGRVNVPAQGDAPLPVPVFIFSCPLLKVLGQGNEGVGGVFDAELVFP